MVDVKYVCKVKFKLVHPAPHHPFKGLVKPLNEFQRFCSVGGGTKSLLNLNFWANIKADLGITLGY
jgi:hypothetical protein